VVRVLSAEEGARGYPAPVQRTVLTAQSAAATPVETGMLEVPAQVTLTVEVTPLSAR